MTCTGGEGGQTLVAVGSGSSVGVVDAQVAADGSARLEGVRATTVPGPATVHVAATSGRPFDVVLTTQVSQPAATGGVLPFTGTGLPAWLLVGAVLAVGVGTVLIRPHRLRARRAAGLDRPGAPPASSSDGEGRRGDRAQREA